MKKSIRNMFILVFGIILFFVNRHKRRQLLLMEKALPEKSEKLLKLERIWQRGAGIHHPKSACGPTSAAMVTKYLVENNRLTYPIPANDTLVNNMYKTVGTLPIGTLIFALQTQLY